MEMVDLVPLLVPVLYVVFSITERRVQERTFAAVEHWRAIGVGFFVMLIALHALLPLVVNSEALRSVSLLNLSGYGLWSVPIALLVTTFVLYWFHRAEHRFHWLWLALHQLHHSAERVDIAGAFITHPLEVVAKLLLSTGAAIFLLGIDPLSAAVLSAVSGSLSMFQHWNVAVPRWVGFLVQRPESHCLHHERNVHARNYSDLPLWDMLFGTFANPASAYAVEVGFGRPAVPHMATMLAMREMELPPTKAQEKG